MGEPSLPRGPRYELLDAWRGVACLAVVVFHSTVCYVATPELEGRLRTTGGSWADWAILATGRMWIGVPLFFVVSGYCIAAAGDSARRKPWAGWTFFYRRFRRIYPPLWIYLALTAAVIALLPAAALPGPTAAYPHPIPYPWDVPAGQWLGSLTLTEEWRHHLAGPERGYFSGQVWTLCFEEQFYLVVGLVVAAARRWLFPAAGVVTALVFLNVADLNTTIGDRLGLDLNAAQVRASGCFFEGLWLSFAAGIAVYYRANYATPLIRRCLDGLLVVGLLWAGRSIASVWAFDSTLTGYLVVSFTFALVLGWLHRFDGYLARSRAVAPLAWCGRMCYSLYLVHAPVTIILGWNLYRLGLNTSVQTLAVTVPLCAAASLALSYLFHRLVERRFLNAPASIERPAAVNRGPGRSTPVAVPGSPLPVCG